MIKEYALEPTVLASWDRFRFFTSQFGCHQGRMISRFPSKWKKFVFEACSKNIMITEGQLKRIELNLFAIESDFDKKFVKNSRDYDSHIEWIKNALLSHKQKPFHAIISDEKYKGTYCADEIDDLTDIWKVDTNLPIRRKPQDLVECFKPFFNLTHDIIFVEPHFDPGTPKWYKAFQYYLSKMFEDGKRYRKIEIHTSAKIESEHFANAFKSKFEKVIIDGYEITVFMWDRIDDNENFHPRYLLSEIGGIRIDYGFDEGGENETTDIQTLGDNIYRLRLSNIQQGTSTFQLKAQIKFNKVSGNLSFAITQNPSIAATLPKP